MIENYVRDLESKIAHQAQQVETVKINEQRKEQGQSKDRARLMSFGKFSSLIKYFLISECIIE